MKPTSPTGAVWMRLNSFIIRVVRSRSSCAPWMGRTDSSRVVELVDENGIGINADETYPEDGVWTSVFYAETLDTMQTYTIRVLYDDEFSDGFGKYSLSVNDPEESYPVIPADGAVLDNTYSTALTPPGVMMSPTAAHPFNMFDGNNGYGLNIKTRGSGHADRPVGQR